MMLPSKHDAEHTGTLIFLTAKVCICCSTTSPINLQNKMKRRAMVVTATVLNAFSWKVADKAIGETLSLRSHYKDRDIKDQS